MIKRYLFIILLLFPFLAYAVAPLVLLGGVLDFSSGLLFSTISRQAVVTVGTSVVDASWFVPMVNLTSRAASIVRLSSAFESVVAPGTFETKIVEIPLIPDTPIPVASNPVLEGSLGSYFNPFPITAPRIKYTSRTNNTGCNVPASYSSDGLTHNMVSGVFNTLAEFLAACQEIFNLNTLQNGSTWTFIFDTYGDPIPVQHNTNTYYVQRTTIAYRVPVSYDDGWSYVRYLTPGSDFSFEITEPSDNVLRFKRDSAGFLPDETDPDWTSAQISSFSSPAAIQFTDANGDVVTIAGNAAGTKIQSATQAGADVKVRTAELDANAQALNVIEQLVRNAQAAAVASQSYSTETNTNTGTGTGTNNGIIFPSDYARQTEAATAAASIVEALKEEGEEPDLEPETEYDEQWDLNFFKDAFTDLFDWTLPEHQSECPKPDLSFEFGGQAFDLHLEAHCDLFEEHNQLFHSIFTLLWFLTALFIVLGA